ncbi:MAG: GNAT family N-acetyltransferase, partial [Chloroflexota bacterium]
YTLRYYLREDYPALTELVHAANSALGDERRITAEQLAVYIDVPDFNPRTDSFIFEDGGRIIAMSNQGFSAASGLCWADSVVHPEYWGQSIGAELIRLSEARCLEWAESALTPEQPVSIRLATGGSNTRAQRLFAAHGYQPARTFYGMRIELDQPVEVAPLPAGIDLRSFDWERDAHAVYEAAMDAFADHWGHERESYEKWAQHILKHPYHDFSLWVVAYAGDEIAGICLNRSDGEDLALAWVGTLGVRPRWRRQGLGRALLRTSFARFQACGYASAELMVDAANLTNAVALYERAGMDILRRRLVYHKLLREQALEETP